MTPDEFKGWTDAITAKATSERGIAELTGDTTEPPIIVRMYVGEAMALLSILNDLRSHPMYGDASAALYENVIAPATHGPDEPTELPGGSPER